MPCVPREEGGREGGRKKRSNSTAEDETEGVQSWMWRAGEGRFVPTTNGRPMDLLEKSVEKCSTTNSTPVKEFGTLHTQLTHG